MVYLGRISSLAQAPELSNQMMLYLLNHDTSPGIWGQDLQPHFVSMKVKKSTYRMAKQSAQDDVNVIPKRG